MMQSSTAAVRPCPICKYPVTFGGGRQITKGYFFLLRTLSGLALKKFHSFHH